MTEPAAATRPGGVTELLRRAGAGDDTAFDEVFALVYEQLHRMARRQLSLQRVGETLGATALVHEAYLKLLRAGDHGWAAHRGTFFAVSARAMRQIVIDHALAQVSHKRGGPDATVVELDPEAHGDDFAAAQRLLEIDDALERLAEIDPRLVDVVECRFYSGLTEEETAEALGLSYRTVQRAWQRARVWLRQILEGGNG